MFSPLRVLPLGRRPSLHRGVYIRFDNVERVLVLTGVDQEEGTYTACELEKNGKAAVGGAELGGAVVIAHGVAPDRAVPTAVTPPSSPAGAWDF